MPSKDPRKYYAENRDRINVVKARWRAANRDRIREQNRQGYARNRAWWQQKRDRISQIKLERGCADCGYREHPAALEFDHTGNDKVADVSALAFGRWELVEAEIAKCDVVCANCHAIRTATRGWGAGRPPMIDAPKPGQPMLW